MVSFDVQSLFTNVPINKALDMINAGLLGDETLEYRTAYTSEKVTQIVHNLLHVSTTVL